MTQMEICGAFVFEIAVFLVAAIAGIMGAWNVFAVASLFVLTAPLWLIAAVLIERESRITDTGGKTDGA